MPGTMLVFAIPAWKMQELVAQTLERAHEKRRFAFRESQRVRSPSVRLMREWMDRYREHRDIRRFAEWVDERIRRGQLFFVSSTNLIF